VLVNSNPATIQTDPEMADKVYLEPLTPKAVTKILEKERPDGILAGMGGQTALNLCSGLSENGTLERLGIELLGTKFKAIESAENRQKFRDLMRTIAEPVPKSEVAKSIAEAKKAVKKIGGYPVLIRPAYTLGGTGGGVATTKDELESTVGRGLALSRIGQVLIEESVLGWKEYEYEVMRDSKDNCITICSMENLDPMGIHTGESIVVAPAQTLSDEDHQKLRSAALKIIRALKIEGGCNIQFAFDGKTGAYKVIEVNPRVSRSSALASKATGCPIARIAAKIAVGLNLDEIRNDITGETHAAFEPTLDYIITKIPRWPFDKFREVDKHIGTQMKSTGEVMAIGRTFEESLLKAIRSLEIDKYSLEDEGCRKASKEELEDLLKDPTDLRIFAIYEALKRGWKIKKIESLTHWDPFFLYKIKNLVMLERKIARLSKSGMVWKHRKKEPIEAKSSRLGKIKPLLLQAKEKGFSDVHLAKLMKMSESEVRKLRRSLGISPVYKMVDTCAAEFAAKTPYYYSTYEGENESVPSNQRKCIIVGSGPIRIGQGIEFDYCCVHAVRALQAEGIEAIMINNNPETVSTDWDQSDKLYFDPLTLEDVLNLIEHEESDGIFLSFGGQTPINLANPIKKYLEVEGLKTKIWGTQPEVIEFAEDRKKFSGLMKKLKVPMPRGVMVYSFKEVKEEACTIGYPVLLRPSWVLGGRAMEIIQSERELDRLEGTLKFSEGSAILIDEFLSDAIEIDVDALSDGKEVFIGGIMEHIEEAGIHSGDSTVVIPPQSLPKNVIKKIEKHTKEIALALETKGLINLQYAIKSNKVWVLEVNPRSSRTIPFLSKAIGIPLAKEGAKIAMGYSLKELKLEKPNLNWVSVKSPVFPFSKLPGVDTILGPEMKSTGEVMGIASTFGEAFYKATNAMGNSFISKGIAFISVSDSDKPKIIPYVKELYKLGFKLVGTQGTASYLREFDIPIDTVWKVYEKRSPDVIDLMRAGKVKLIINTPSSKPEGSRKDGYQMRRVAVDLQIPFISNISAARAMVDAIKKVNPKSIKVKSLNEWSVSAF
jgi:carbamoyl-phosphate synthase large subunit